MTGMRCFFALALERSVTRPLREAQSVLQAQSLPGMRVIPEQNLHLTLKFIESLADELLEPLCEQVGAALHHSGAFELSLKGYGAFPNPDRSRIFWAGVDDPQARLPELATTLDRVGRSLDIPTEKRAFTAHITLARFRRPCLLPLQAMLPQLPELQQPFQVNEVTLFRSHTDPSGAVYTPLADFPL